MNQWGNQSGFGATPGSSGGDDFFAATNRPAPTSASEAPTQFGQSGQFGAGAPSPYGAPLDSPFSAASTQFGGAVPPQAAPYGGQAQAVQAYGGQYVTTSNGGGFGMPVPALAGLGARLAASIIDSLLMGLIPVIVLSVGLPVYLASLTPDPTTATQTSPDAPGAGALLLMMLLVVVMVFWYPTYQTVMHAKWGATVGKMIMGIKVVGPDGRNRPTWTQSAMRAFVIYLASGVTSGVLGFIDAIWCLWDPQRQCLHDKLAKTTVVVSR